MEKTAASATDIVIELENLKQMCIRDSTSAHVPCKEYNSTKDYPSVHADNAATSIWGCLFTAFHHIYGI